MCSSKWGAVAGILCCFDSLLNNVEAQNIPEEEQKRECAQGTFICALLVLFK